MCGQIVGVDRLQGLKLLLSVKILFLQIVDVSEFLPCLPQAGKERNYILLIFFSNLKIVLESIDQSPIVQRSRVSRSDRASLGPHFQRWFVLVVAGVAY